MAQVRQKEGASIQKRPYSSLTATLSLRGRVDTSLWSLPKGEREEGEVNVF